MAVTRRGRGSISCDEATTTSTSPRKTRSVLARLSCSAVDVENSLDATGIALGPSVTKSIKQPNASPARIPLATKSNHPTAPPSCTSLILDPSSLDLKSLDQSSGASPAVKTASATALALESAMLSSTAIDIINSVISPERYQHRRRESLGVFDQTPQQRAEGDTAVNYATPCLLRATSCQLNISTPHTDDTSCEDISAAEDCTGQKKQKRRLSRRLSYMSATRTALAQRETELMQCTDEMRLNDLKAEISEPHTVQLDCPGSVERKRRPRRSNSVSRRSSPITNGSTRELRSRSSLTSNAVPVAASNETAHTQTQALPVETPEIAPDVSAESNQSLNPQDNVTDIVAAVPEIQQGPLTTTTNSGEKNEKPPKPSSSSSINDVFSDFLNNWKSKKSQQAAAAAKITPLAAPSSPEKQDSPVKAVSTPKRNAVSIVTPSKDPRRIVSFLNSISSSAQRCPPQKGVRLLEGRSYSTRMSQPGSGKEAELLERVPHKAAAASKPLTLNSPIRVLAQKTTRMKESSEGVSKKRKSSFEAEDLAPASKTAKIATPSAIPQPSSSRASSLPLGSRRSLASRPQTPAPAAAPRTRQNRTACTASTRRASVQASKLNSMTAQDMTRLVHEFTAANRVYRCEFDRRVEEREGARPTSPTAKRQSQLAAQARVRRSKLAARKGWAFGAGDDEDWDPKASRASATARVHWDEHLETNLTELQRTSPTEIARQSRAHRRVRKSLAILLPPKLELPSSIDAGERQDKLSLASHSRKTTNPSVFDLDDCGNLVLTRRSIPLTPEVGKPCTIVVTKVLYAGEADELA
ncbi:hypothetical protein PYCC9005_001779 [Savitreella phatthalungensis]